MKPTKEGDVNIRIRRATNRRLKAYAGKVGMSVKDLLDAYSRVSLFKVAGGE